MPDNHNKFQIPLKSILFAIFLIGIKWYLDLSRKSKKYRFSIWVHINCESEPGLISPPTLSVIGLTLKIDYAIRKWSSEHSFMSLWGGYGLVSSWWWLFGSHHKILKLYVKINKYMNYAVTYLLISQFLFHWFMFTELVTRKV